METTLDKLQEIQRRCLGDKNISCDVQVQSHNTRHWSIHLFFFHDREIKYYMKVDGIDFANHNVYRLDMILQHGLFGRLKG